MVFLTKILLNKIILSSHKAKANAKPLRNYLKRGFIDKIQIHAKGGTGGCGLARYGGRGGNGGDVYIVAEEGLSLSKVATRAKEIKKFAASTGYDSTKKGILGRGGDDLEISVPVGVIAYDKTGNKIGEVDKPGKKLIIAEGGVGGCAETGYGGTKGQEHRVILDLKLISDVSLVGFPNAGKSTLISVVSKTKPRIASYPFTTVRPHLGIIRYEDLRTITITDLPGLIEGAHQNIGMGHDFLKHLERSKILVFVVDVNGFRLSHKYKARNCIETILLLNKEIELYKPEILDSPALLIVNKLDLPGAEEEFEKVKPKLENLEKYSDEFPEEMCPERVLKFEEVIPLSLKNVDKENIRKLEEKIREVLDKTLEIEEQKIEDEIPEYKLVQKLNRQFSLDAPVLL